MVHPHSFILLGYWYKRRYGFLLSLLSLLLRVLMWLSFFVDLRHWRNEVKDLTVGVLHKSLGANHHGQRHFQQLLL